MEKHYYCVQGLIFSYCRLFHIFIYEVLYSSFYVCFKAASSAKCVGTRLLCVCVCVCLSVRDALTAVVYNGYGLILNCISLET